MTSDTNVVDVATNSKPNDQRHLGIVEAAEISRRRRRNSSLRAENPGNLTPTDDWVRRFWKIKYRNDRINFFSRRDEALLLVYRNDYTAQRIL